MNYFAHGRTFVDEPYVLAGTAVPDWLNVIDRRMRIRSRHAAPFVHDADPLTASIARGILRHHHDDDWFHQTRAFAELNLEFAVRLRDALPGDEGFRPHFLGHILVELLLDAVLIAEEPARLDRYYAALVELDPAVVEAALNRMSVRQTDKMGVFLPRFLRERFLYEYGEAGKLLTRLNHVLTRVGLPPLPDSIRDLLDPMRDDVARRRFELLAASPPAVQENAP